MWLNQAQRLRANIGKPSLKEKRPTRHEAQTYRHRNTKSFVTISQYQSFKISASAHSPFAMAIISTVLLKLDCHDVIVSTHCSRKIVMMLLSTSIRAANWLPTLSLRTVFCWQDCRSGWLCWLHCLRCPSELSIYPQGRSCSPPWCQAKISS